MIEVMIEQKTPETYAQKLELAQAVAELNTKEKEITSSKGYWKAYIASVLFPPIGIYYFIKYLFFNGGGEESVKAGVISLVLTIASLLISFWMLADLFRGATSSLPQQDFQMLKDLAAPDNQKKLLDLYK